MDSDADRLAMLQGLGGQTITATGGTFTAIFDNGYADSLGGPAVEGTEPRLTARTSDLTSLSVGKGDTLTIASVAWKVSRTEPDGTGITIVILKK